MSGSYANLFTWEQVKKGPFCHCWRFRFIPRPSPACAAQTSQKTTTKQHASIAGSSRPPEPEQHITSPCSLQSSEANQTQKSEMDRGGAASPPRGRRRSGRAGRGDDGGGGRTSCPATASAQRRFATSQREAGGRRRRRRTPTATGTRPALLRRRRRLRNAAADGLDPPRNAERRGGRRLSYARTATIGEGRTRRQRGRWSDLLPGDGGGGP